MTDGVRYKGPAFCLSKYSIQGFMWDRYQDDIGHYFFVSFEGRGDVAACTSNEAAHAAQRLMATGE